MCGLTCVYGNQSAGKGLTCVIPQGDVYTICPRLLKSSPDGEQAFISDDDRVTYHALGYLARGVRNCCANICGETGMGRENTLHRWSPVSLVRRHIALMT